MTNNQLRQLLASYIEDEMETITDDENLLDTGLDSMMLMAIVEELRSHGFLVSFLELSEQPTIKAWLKKIHTHASV